MPYKYAHERENYEMYASGSVLVSAPGHPAFPIRLANEIFRRCMAFREARGATGRCTLYDPCCGGAYHLTTMAFFNWAEIDHIIASDIDDDAVTVARRNLALLQPDGMARRIAEIEAMRAEFGKESHALALENAHTLAGRLTGLRQDHARPLPDKSGMARARRAAPTRTEAAWCCSLRQPKCIIALEVNC